MIKKAFQFLFLLISVCSFAQNKPILYGFGDIPQTILLNPGSETAHKFYVGIPLLSGISLESGTTSFVVSDLFGANSISYTDKVNSVLRKISANDHVKINAQVELFSGGFHLNKELYLSFGFYEEIDAISYVPKDILTLANEGNAAYLNNTFSLAQLQFKADVLGVLHFGARKKINDKFTLGGRFKLYSSSVNVRSGGNTGTFKTTQGENNILKHSLHNIDVAINTSGIYNENGESGDSSDLYKNTFLGGNLGVGFDVGFTYHLSKQLELTGSIIDFGFINYTKKNKTYTVKGDYTVEGINFLYDPENPRDYIAELSEDFEGKIKSEENEDSYTLWRPTQIYAALKYSFGKKRARYCYDLRNNDYFSNALGLQLHSVFRPLSPQMALTGFYEAAFSNKFKTKITYTIDDYSFYNVGAGFSAHIGIVNVYAMIDNVFDQAAIASSNKVSYQLGINLIFN